MCFVLLFNSEVLSIVGRSRFFHLHVNGSFSAELEVCSLFSSSIFARQARSGTLYLSFCWLVSGDLALSNRFLISSALPSFLQFTKADIPVLCAAIKVCC